MCLLLYMEKNCPLLKGIAQDLKLKPFLLWNSPPQITGEIYHMTVSEH